MPDLLPDPILNHRQKLLYPLHDLCLTPARVCASTPPLYPQGFCTPPCAGGAPLNQPRAGVARYNKAATPAPDRMALRYVTKPALSRGGVSRFAKIFLREPAPLHFFFQCQIKQWGLYYNNQRGF